MSQSPGRKEEAVAAFLASGRTIAEVAEEYRLSEPTLREWIREAAEAVVSVDAAASETPAEPDDDVEPDISSAEYQAQVVAWYQYTGQTIAEVAGALNLPECLVREWVWNASPGDVQADTRPEWAREVNELESSEPGIELPAPADVAPTEAETALRAELEAARAETAAAYAAAVEAVLRTEVAAADAVARAEALAAHTQARYESACVELGAARAEIAILEAAEAAARDEIKATYAEAVEAMIGAELAAEEKIEEAKLATAAKAVAYSRAVAADAQAVVAEAVERVAKAEQRAATAEALAQVRELRADACLPAPDPSPARVQDRQTVVVI